MKYPSPRTILTYLATHGPSSVQSEAVQLFSDLPERWPTYTRGSREALLRRLACNGKKSVKARLGALKELLTVKPPQQVDAKEPSREEVDALLAQAAHDLGMSLDAEDPKPLPESTAAKFVEPPGPLLPVPQSGPSSEPLESPVGAVQIPDTKPHLRDKLLEQGRKLATRVLAQVQRCELCPFNKQESHRLDALQRQFETWEREASAKGIDTMKEFPDRQLRLPQLRVNRSSDLATLVRRNNYLACAPEPWFVPPQTPRDNTDSGMWGGTLGI